MCGEFVYEGGGGGGSGGGCYVGVCGSGGGDDAGSVGSSLENKRHLRETVNTAVGKRLAAAL